jgi:hypothetical protein
VDVNALKGAKNLDGSNAVVKKKTKAKVGGVLGKRSMTLGTASL